ncbi:hypothetical protein CapIbe_016351, partial [Capra ibex]
GSGRSAPTLPARGRRAPLPRRTLSRHPRAPRSEGAVGWEPRAPAPRRAGLTHLRLRLRDAGGALPRPGPPRWPSPGAGLAAAGERGMPGRRGDKSGRPSPRRRRGRGSSGPSIQIPRCQAPPSPPGPRAGRGLGPREAPGSCGAVAQRPDGRSPHPRGGRAGRGGGAEELAVPWATVPRGRCRPAAGARARGAPPPAAPRVRAAQRRAAAAGEAETAGCAAPAQSAPRSRGAASVRSRSLRVATEPPSPRPAPTPPELAARAGDRPPAPSERAHLSPSAPT